jgi:hypothetical protein
MHRWRMRKDPEQGREWPGLTTHLPRHVVTAASGLGGRRRGAADQAEGGSLNSGTWLMIRVAASPRRFDENP